MIKGRGCKALSGLALIALLTLAGCKDREQQTEAPAPAKQPSVATKPASPKPASAERGKQLFQQTCAACHGMEGQGVPNLGKDMTTSPFIKSQSDTELLAFIKTGRLPGDPANTTGVAMPPKGGNPALQDDQLRDIIAYIRSMQR